MVSLHGLLVLASFFIEAFFLILFYPIRGGINEKYRNNLKQSLKVLFSRKSLAFPVLDAKIVSFYTNSALLWFIGKIKYPKLTSGLNKYGEKYDSKSIWLVEALNRSKNDPIIIYLHGGGYYCQTSYTQIESLISIYHLIEPSKRSKLSILLLDYSLASYGNQLLTQLHELGAVYHNLTFKDGNTNIILMGDSAGGHLAVTFEQFLKKQNNSAIPYPKSLVLISPWVKLSPDKIQYKPGHSYKENESRDLVQYTFFTEPDRGKTLVGNTDILNNWTSPGNCPYAEKDWKDIPTFSQPGYSVLVIVGEHESFKDDILEFSHYALGSSINSKTIDGSSKGIFNESKHLEIFDYSNGPYVEIVVEPWGVHVGSLFLENEIIDLLNKHPNLNYKNLDDYQFFGIKRIVGFLDKTL
ncbi:hypothetical protein KGF54_000863 [Candida jiufengensis]|uniref:uncharacterized protein n=1 Tax=Candida jiufengensis TaxID=497108 RepID=UPI0022245356|nr:uncharacterized protein KGF54_000863 [Candida jiufengensis]KAI5956388.1 hypothetical protein KGF54_000863 [Candida jiufengensis]